MTRHYFAGANTPHGFFGYYDDILPAVGTNKKIYIKGGSGTGKSTLMKKTAGIFAKKDYNIEYFHCTNDAESIDGINVVGAGIAVVDGTNPHPADPKLPCATDEIFNASDYLDKAYISENKTQLTELLSEKKGYYDRAYGYLNAAYEVYQLNEQLYRNALNWSALNVKTLEILKLFDETEPVSRTAWNRRLFTAAITPDGVKSLADSSLKAGRTYILNGIGAMGIFEMLDTVQRNANLMGLDTISFKSPLAPDKTGHLYMRELDTAFISANRYHEYEAVNAEQINFTELLNRDILVKHQGEIDYNSEIFDELLKRAIVTMAASKSFHSQIEGIYSEGMDFKRMHRAYDAVLEWLLEEPATQTPTLPYSSA